MTTGVRARMILQRDGEHGPPSQTLADQINAERALAVLDRGEHAMLIEGEPHALDALAETLEGWKMLPVRAVPRPDTRERVMKPPRQPT